MSVQKRNNVQVQGDGPATMFLAHGFGCDQNMWRLLAPHCFVSLHAPRNGPQAGVGAPPFARPSLAPCTGVSVALL